MYLKMLYGYKGRLVIIEVCACVCENYNANRKINIFPTSGILTLIGKCKSFIYD